jgi:hypothetical protein
MSDKPKKVREKIGDIFQINLGDGTFAYGQVVSKVEYAFFNFVNDGSIPNFLEIINSNALFRISVDRYVIRDGVWKILGKALIRDELLQKQNLFSFDRHTNEYTIWSPEGRRLANPDEIQDLECFASWGHKSVEQRLRDHFAGRPNYDVELERQSHKTDFPDIITFYKQYGYDFSFGDDEESNAE